jgi:hypothetical protein
MYPTPPRPARCWTIAAWLAIAGFGLAVCWAVYELLSLLLQ